MTQAEQNFNENNIPIDAAVSDMTELLTLFRQMEFSIKTHMISQNGPLYILRKHRL